MAEGSAGRRLRDMTTLFRSGTLAGLTDGELLRRAGAATGEEAEALFEAIVDRHGPMVHRVCRGTLGDAADADDAFQATFLVLARRLREARRLESVGGWLHGIATRVAARARVDAARRRKHERARGVLAVVAPDAPELDADRAVREEVGRLPSRYREVVVLCYWEGLTHEQAAARLGCPLGTVRSRSARARDLLRRRLARRGLAPEGVESESIVMPAVPVALVRGAASAAAETLAGRPALGLVGVRAVELSRHVLRRMFMFKLAQAGAASALALIAIVGLGRAGTPPEEPAVAAAPAAEEAGQTPPRVFRPYVVQPPDLLLVEVLEALPGRPISGERLVRPDGNLSLGFYGDVHVAGLTIPEVKEKIVRHLMKYLSDDLLGLVEFDPKTDKPVPIAPGNTDRVFVDVTAYNSQFYYLIGAFRNPDRFHCTGSETILDAVVLAGGLADDADVLLVRDRPEPGQEKTETVDVDAILKGSEGAVNHRLQPGDRLIARRIEGGGGETPDDAPSTPRIPSPLHSPAPHARLPQATTRRDAPKQPTMWELKRQLQHISHQLGELSKKLDERP
ncbi:sigma-70 family RNA polymerase sigma factor [Paludisphaera soli]|uniref:sigma-70 family RNA polymerase sigma factor n=1 Tax=Paludisphaera soli TaxID=2712865 RepID=UPI0013EAE4DC|nr:sigma-70 family RNA polymerase sigma factor [Paludisphaera soli]